MRERVVISVIGAAASLVVVVILFAHSERNLNYQYASFERHFGEVVASAADSLDLNSRSYYVAGHTQHTAYLANANNPAHLIAVSKDLHDTVHYTLRVDTDSLRYRAIRVAVDSPHYYLADGTQPFIYRGVLGGTAVAWMRDTQFMKVIPLSGSSVGLVAIRNMENTIVKKVMGAQEPEVYGDILEEQGEGLFSTDGMLRYDRECAHVVYVYFYRNEYIVMDTTFRIVRRGNTIDTISRAKIDPAFVRSRNVRTMKAPPLKVNNESAVGGNALYVQSNLLARNEDVRDFESGAVVDVYDLEALSYRRSLYLPARGGKRPRELFVMGGALYALYGSKLVRFDGQ